VTQYRRLQELQQLEVANAILLEESLTDPLTGLPNRRVMDRTVEEQVNNVRGARRASP